MFECQNSSKHKIKIYLDVSTKTHWNIDCLKMMYITASNLSRKGTWSKSSLQPTFFLWNGWRLHFKSGPVTRNDRIKHYLHVLQNECRLKKLIFYQILARRGSEITLDDSPSLYVCRLQQQKNTFVFITAETMWTYYSDMDNWI